MRKYIYLLMIFFCVSCDTENVPDCVKATGTIMEKEVELPFFDKVNVFGHVKLYITQGEEQQVRIEAGKNFIEEVAVEVIENELRISEKNDCNLFREYGTTKVYVTVPNLRRIQNSSSAAIESIGILEFPHLSLYSENQANDSNVYTTGDFILNVKCEGLRITNDNISKYFLSGTTEFFRPGFFGGDGRLEAANLIAQDIEIFHRGSNKMIVNPQQSISGEIRSTGDVIAVNEPPIVTVESFYTGSLFFQ